MALGKSLEDIDEMPMASFNEFLVFDKIEPIGDRRSDLLMGILASVIANCNRSSKQAPFQPEQFMPKWDAEEAEPQTAEQQKAILMMLKDVMDERMKDA